MHGVEKLKTGIDGFDVISEGGIPRNRTTLVSGTSGSGKTVFASQFVAQGIENFNQKGVFVTFEETPQDIKKNVLSFGWDFERWENERKLKFVDCSPNLDDDMLFAGDYNLGALISRIKNAIESIDAKRVVIDSLGSIFRTFQNHNKIRGELFKVVSALRNRGITSIITAERVDEYGTIARYGVEEFVTDNVIILRNTLDEEKRRRTIEILKFRGAYHQKGQFPFTICKKRGLVVIPLSAIKLKQESSKKRVTSGNKEIDKMCSGGFFRDSIILISGATGTGKTLSVTEFIKGGVQNDERCVLFAFEESRAQLIRNAQGWGIDFEKMEEEGRLKLICVYPELMGLEDHLVRIKDMINKFKPNRIALDSLTALERVSTLRGFREFVIGLTSYIKKFEILGLFTVTSPTLLGGTSITETHISTITDSIILLKYLELGCEMRRGITILKMRGSMHDKAIREFRIDENGMHIGEPFKNITGVLSGSPTNFLRDGCN